MSSGMYAGCHADYISVIVFCFRYPRLVVCTQAVTWITLVLLCYVSDTHVKWYVRRLSRGLH